MMAADAPPPVRPSAMWSTVPAPPDAITGTFTDVGDRAGDVEVVARRGAVAIDAVHHDLAGAEVLAPPHPVERVETGGQAGAVDEDLVAARDPVAEADVLHLGAEHDALATEGLGALAEDLRVADGHGVDADLLRARLEHFEHVVDRADTPADGERHEHVVRDARARSRGRSCASRRWR